VQFVGYALLVPFFGWGIYLLRRRFLYYEENSMGLEVATTAFVAFVFWIETLALREVLSGHFLLYLSAILGLSMAGFALYAHVVISLVSRMVVEMVAPGEDSALDHPRFGPVDTLERDGDYEAALDEYLVLARIYPRNFEVLSRAANAHVMLGRIEDAANWYIRARKRARRVDDALEAVNALVRLYDNELDLPERADYHLARFIRDFPDAPDTDIVRDRLNRRAKKTDWSVSDFLEALDDDPLSEPGLVPSPESLPAVGPPLAPPHQQVELVSLESEGAAESAPVPDGQREQDKYTAKSAKEYVSALTPLSDSDIVATKREDKSRGKRVANGKGRAKTPARKASGLQALDEVGPITPEEPQEPSKAKKTSAISLEPMEDNGA